MILPQVTLASRVLRDNLASKSCYKSEFCVEHCAHETHFQES